MRSQQLVAPGPERQSVPYRSMLRKMTLRVELSGQLSHEDDVGGQIGQRGEFQRRFEHPPFQQILDGSLALNAESHAGTVALKQFVQF